MGFSSSQERRGAPRGSPGSKNRRLVLLRSSISAVVALGVLTATASVYAVAGNVDESKSKCPSDFKVFFEVHPKGSLTHKEEGISDTGGKLTISLMRPDGITPCVAPSPGIDIDFKGSEFVTPTLVPIPSGKSYATADLASTKVVEVNIQSIANAPDGLKNLVPLSLKFISPVSGIFVEVENPQLIDFYWPPKAKLKVRLLDRNQQPTTRNDNVIVNLDVELAPQPSSPSSAASKSSQTQVLGEIRPKTLTFKPGDGALDAEYTPGEESGLTKIVARGTVNGRPLGGWAIPLIDFSYAWWDGHYIFLCILASLVGAFLRSLEESQIRRNSVKPRDLGKLLFSGVLGGLLLFLIGRKLLRTEFNDALIAMGSRPIAALYWGLLGGYLGPLVIVRKLKPLPQDEEKLRTR
jgi:hypothetical protein